MVCVGRTRRRAAEQIPVHFRSKFTAATHSLDDESEGVEDRGWTRPMEGDKDEDTETLRSTPE